MVASGAVSRWPVCLRFRCVGMFVVANRNLKAIDLFSGAGGMSLGLQLAGFDVVGAIEVDPAACDAYRLNHPTVRLWQRDIRRVTGNALMRKLRLKRGTLDLLAACPPCQGFSSVRTKNGRQSNQDPRNDLVYEVLRFARSMKPKTIMLENVPGLVKDERYATLLDRLTSLGYRLTSDVLDAGDFGVPQRRRRLVLLASRVSQPAFATPAPRARTVRQQIGKLVDPARSKDPMHGYKRKHSQKVLDLMRRIPRDGGSRAALGAEEQLPCHKRLAGFSDVYGRMAWDRPAPTITGGCTNPSKGRFIHPSADRAITLREAALLQTFPARYQFPLNVSRETIALLIGNALPPEFIRRQAAALIRTGFETDDSAGT